MATKRTFLAGVWLIPVVTACGPATPAAEVSPSAPATAAKQPDGPAAGLVVAGEADEALDLTPVPAPGERVVHVRWKHPAATFSTLAGFTTIPSNVVDAGLRSATRAFVSDQLWEEVDVDALADLINLDAPVDMVIVVGKDSEGKPEPMAAFSVGLTSLAGARNSSKRRARQVSRGVWRLGGEREFGDVCVVAASAGKTPARLICGDNNKEVLGLARYLATTVAAEPAGAHDLQLQLRMRAVLDRYQGDIAKASEELRKEADSLKREFPALAGEAQQILDALAQELIDVAADADGVTMQMDVDAHKGLHVKAQLRFAGKRSWTVGSMLDGAQLRDTAPELFWRLPQDSHVASYSRSADPARYQPLVSVLQKGAKAMLEDAGVGSAADRTALVKLLRLPVSKHVAVVSASGHFPNAGSGGGSLKAVVEDTLGWYLYGVDESPTQLRGYLRELVRAYNRPTLQRQMKKALGSEAKSLPRLRTIPPPAGLGAGAMAIELVVPQLDDPLDPNLSSANPQAAKRVDVRAHIVMMADGKRTWLGFASQRTELAKLMSKLRGKGGKGNLGARSDLGSFKRDKHAAGSFTDMSGITGTLKPIVDAMLPLGPGAQSKAGQRISNAFDKLPNGGSTPITSFVDVDAGARPTTTITLHMPRESLADLGFLVGETVSALDSP